MGIDYNNVEDSTVSAAVSVEETLEVRACERSCDYA